MYLYLAQKRPVRQQMRGRAGGLKGRPPDEPGDAGYTSIKRYSVALTDEAKRTKVTAEISPLCRVGGRRDWHACLQALNAKAPRA